MTNAIASLSLFSGAAVVAITGAILAVPFIWVRNRVIQLAAAFALPVIVAYCLYWSPIWLGATKYSAEYFVWAFLPYAAWSGAGTLGFVTVLLIHLVATGRRQSA